jgi:zinc and cadmium transporter
MSVFLPILASVILVSLLSFVGIFFLALKSKTLERILIGLVAFASGAMLGGAFLHLLPESLESGLNGNVFIYVILGIVLFFILEKFLYWRHCHEAGCDIHAFAYLNLIGDGIHNFIDGIIIAVSFLASISLGLTSTLAIILHEVPQEIGDFGVIVYGGIGKNKALGYNFISALTAVFGAFFAYFLFPYVENLTTLMLPLAAGGFIYIAGTDLMPELHKRRKMKESLTQLILLLLGIALMWSLKIFIE